MGTCSPARASTKQAASRSSTPLPPLDPLAPPLPLPPPRMVPEPPVPPLTLPPLPPLPSSELPKVPRLLLVFDPHATSATATMGERKRRVFIMGQSPLGQSVPGGAHHGSHPARKADRDRCYP